MKEVKIVSRYDSSKVLVCGRYESVKDCLEKNRDEVNLSRANLSGIKNYSENHSVFIQLIQNNSSKFTQKQQEVASTIFAFTLCWKSIKKRYNKESTLIFKKLAKLGWDEYLTEWDEA